MKKLLCLMLFASCAMAGEIHFRQSGAASPSGWTAWSDRAETAPRSFVDPIVSRGNHGSLGVSGDGNVAAFGGWQRSIAGIKEGSWYRYVVHYRAEGLTSENWQVLPRLDWQKADGTRAGSYEQVDYASRSMRKGSWTEVSLDTQAPAGAASAVLELYLAHAPTGIIWWDDIAFDEIPAPSPRKVTITTVNLMPEKTGSAAASVGEFIKTAEKLAAANTDLILLPEGITVVGTGKSYAEVAEPIPGPTTARLGELAREKHSYVVAGLYERERGAIYNTAVLIDRRGDLVGRYRKVHLPRLEMEQLTPGNEFPVFRTDFGTVGMMICYDVFFPEPARQLAMRGAEIILLPIWGGDETLAKARAIENQIFLVSSGYDHPTYIMDPTGKRLSEAPNRGTAATATIDLSTRYLYLGLWDWKNRRPREYRPDVQTEYLFSDDKAQ